jgi:hypothetical protein
MNLRLTRLLVGLYPRKWRERYGAEFADLLLAEPGGLRNVADVVQSAIRERVAPPKGPNKPLWSIGQVARQLSAFVPISMSLTALAVVLCHIAVYGTAREADEGATAHIWQILMAGQMPILAFFAIKWFPRAPKQSLCVLAAQAGAALASMAPVFLLNL